MPSVRANGLEVGYDVMGAGPPLVALHGATSSGSEDFAAQIPSMSKAFRLYLPDARGHGRTRWDVAAGFSQEQLVADLAAFVDALGLSTFHLLGFSMGAMTSMAFATRSSARLRTLVLVGITPQREPRTRRRAPPDGSGADPARRPRWASELTARHDPVQGEGAWQRLLRAISAAVSTQPLHRRAICERFRRRPWSCAGIATRSCRWTKVGGWPASCRTPDCSWFRIAATRS